MIPKGKYYGRFDYDRYYGDNPFTDATGKVGGLVDRMTRDFNSSRSPTSRVARVGDREIEDYMSNVLSGQRNTLDDYVRQAAGAGIKRGGMTTVGGPSLDSSLHHRALDTLARGYSDRFKEALDYDKYAKDTEYSQYSDNLRNMGNMMGVQQRFLQSKGDWQNRFGDTVHSDWRGDVDWNRESGASGTDSDGSGPTTAVSFGRKGRAAEDYEEALRKLQLEKTRSDMDMDSWRNLMERRGLTKDLRSKEDTEQMWQKLIKKARMAEMSGRSAADWSTEEELWLDRLGVSLGYLQPWNRSYSVKRGR